MSSLPRPCEIVVAPHMRCPTCGRTIRVSTTGAPYRHRGAGGECPYPGRGRR